MIISGDRQISYGDIHARIARAATGFRALGVQGGKPVGMMLRNDFALFEVVAASPALGSPVVPINWHLKADEVGYILSDSGADTLVCHADLLPQIREGLPPWIKLLVVTTPPEIAAAYGVAPATTRVPDGMTDWDIWRDTHQPSIEFTTTEVVQTRLQQAGFRDFPVTSVPHKDNLPWNIDWIMLKAR